jgi:eukaryotic-like serine/threonine-protein kinase
MAKLIEDRYQSIKEFADDLREVRRPTPAEKLVLDTATYPLGQSDVKVKEEEAVAPLAISKTFDSFDATLRLAAMTDQTDDFRDYITATAKMRAYRGKIEPHSPLAAAAAKAPTKEAPRVIFDNPVLSGTGTNSVPAPPASNIPNLIAFGAIVILIVAALALTVALFVK